MWLIAYQTFLRLNNWSLRICGNLDSNAHGFLSTSCFLFRVFFFQIATYLNLERNDSAENEKIFSITQCLSRGSTLATWVLHLYLTLRFPVVNALSFFPCNDTYKCVLEYMWLVFSDVVFLLREIFRLSWLLTLTQLWMTSCIVNLWYWRKV